MIVLNPNMHDYIKHKCLNIEIKTRWLLGWIFFFTMDFFFKTNYMPYTKTHLNHLNTKELKVK